MTTKNWLKGIFAGFIATVVLSALMLMKQRMGLMPQLNPVGMLTNMAGGSTPAVGWTLHFLIGTGLWGTLFPWFDARIPDERTWVGSHWIKGTLFGIGAWILMMILVMPMAGAGLFGINLGVMAPVMTLIMHVIDGLVLGGIYGLERREPAHELQVSHR